MCWPISWSGWSAKISVYGNSQPLGSWTGSWLLPSANALTTQLIRAISWEYRTCTQVVSILLVGPPPQHPVPMVWRWLQWQQQHGGTIGASRSLPHWPWIENRITSWFGLPVDSWWLVNYLRFMPISALRYVLCWFAQIDIHLHMEFNQNNICSSALTWKILELGMCRNLFCFH